MTRRRFTASLAAVIVAAALVAAFASPVAAHLISFDTVVRGGGAPQPVSAPAPDASPAPGPGPVPAPAAPSLAPAARSPAPPAPALAPPAAGPAGAGVEVRVLLRGTREETPAYIIRGTRPGATVMLVGGVHGNEVAGYLAARQMKDWRVAAGTLIVLPEANRPAVQANRRYVSGQTDLNRAFPRSSGESPDNALAREIWALVKEFRPQWLLDMHEGYFYYKDPSTSSVGQTLITFPTAAGLSFGRTALAEINRDIGSSLKQFTQIRYPISGSLARGRARCTGSTPSSLRPPARIRCRRASAIT